MKPFKLITALAAIFLLKTALFANYQSTYIPDQVLKDFSENNYGKYQVDTIPTVSLVELKSKGVYNAESTLTRHISGAMSFNAIVAADVCKVDNSAAYSSTIYETDLANGVITCMYAVKGDLYNPIGLYKVIVPEIKAFYTINTAAAVVEKATEIAAAEAQFHPLLQKKEEIIAQMEQEMNAGFLTIPELLMAAVLTDDEIIDIEATRATGKFQLKSGYTSKFTESGEVVDNSEYLLADAATIFEVYSGLGTVSMNFLMILVIGFGAYGLIHFAGGKISDKIEKKQSGGSTPYLVGLMAGVVLFFPVNQSDLQTAVGAGEEYELLKTRYQGFEKFGYYTFGNWGKESAKVIIDAEIDALIRKSGLGTKEQIASTWAQKVQSARLSDFYTNNYNLCLNNIYLQDKLMFDDKKGVYSETDKGLFPSSEHWAWVTSLAKSANGYYDVAPRGLLAEGASGAGDYPKLAFSSCGKADYLSNYYKERQGQFEKSFNHLITTNNGGGGKIDMLGTIFEFQYELYRDWGYLAILGLPVTKMQTESIGGLYKTKTSEVLEKLNQNIAGDNKMLHGVLSSMPYMLLPGSNTVFGIVKDNAMIIGAASGATIAASQSEDGALSALLGVIGGVFGGVTAKFVPGADAALGLAFSYQAAKVLLATLCQRRS